MPIRWKLLVLMLCISLGPILFLRWNGERSMQRLGHELAATTRSVLIDGASRHLLTMVEEHALVLRRERELLELALQLQTSVLEQALAGGDVDRHASPERVQAAGTTSGSGVRIRETRMGKIKAFDVSHDDITLLNSGAGSLSAEPLRRKLQAAVPTLKALALKHPKMILWQWIVFNNDIQAIYPSVSRLPMMFHQHRQRPEWFLQARKRNGMSWSSPIVDPLTRQITLVVAMPFQTPQDQTAGVNAIVVPLGQLLQEDAHIRHLSHNATSMLVRAETRPDRTGSVIRIIAREYDKAAHHRGWLASAPDEWLPSDPSAPDYPRMVLDLKEKRSGVAEIAFDGVEHILAYGSIDDYGTSLLLAARQSEVVNEAVTMEKSMLKRVDRLIAVTGAILVAVVVFVVAIAMFFSKSITNNIQKLVDASRKLAEGDFNARADIRTSDEIGELGRIFDRMVPELKDHVQIKQALDVAMEIQQNLLPQAIPDLPGIDMAGKSIYCDETGGDFYDFLDFCCRDQDTLGVAVGDVSGHGIPAALLMATARAFLRCRVTQPGDIAAIINDINRLLVGDTVKTNQFLTLFYLELDASQKRLQWIRAGHDAALLYDPETDTFEKLMGRGLSMGIDDRHTYSANIRENLTAGQVICISTDGIWEAVNPQKEMFGRERIESIVRQKHAGSAHGIMTSITDELSLFRGSEKQIDDATLVVIKIL